MYRDCNNDVCSVLSVGSMASIFVLYCRSQIIVLYIHHDAHHHDCDEREDGRFPAMYPCDGPSIPPLHSKSGATKIPLPVALDSRNSRVPLSLALFLLSLRYHMGRARIPFKALQIIYVSTGRPLLYV